MDRRQTRLLEEGILLFNRGQFFEAHEVWEDAWRRARDEDRLLLHGLIQVAAGFHKLQCGQPSGTVSLLTKGIAKLAALPAGGFLPGLPSFRDSVESWKGTAARMAGSGSVEYDASAIPRIDPSRSHPFLSRLLSDIEIAAPAERVWSVLTRFDAYPDWNPFIRSIRGEARAGARLAVSILAAGDRTMTLRTRVLRADERRELRWRGRLLLPGIFDGEHVFSIAPLDAGRVRLSQRETFRGLLVPALGRVVFGATLAGFEEMNRALKLRAEQPADPASSVHPSPMR